MLNYLKYRLKTITRQKDLMFWTLCFPLILATFFNIAFANLEFTFNESINVAVVGNKDELIIEVMEETQLNDVELFNLEFVNEQEAQELLKEHEVSGILELDGDEVKLILNQNDMRASVLNEFLNSYIQRSTLMNTQVMQNPELLTNGWIMETLDFTNYLNQNEENLVVLEIMFLSVIGLGIFMGSYISFEGMRNIYAKIEKKSARVNLSALPKYKMILADAAVSFVLICVFQIISYFYITEFIGINLSDNIVVNILIIVLGCFVAVGLGYAVALVFKKESYLTPITMIWGALAGMFSPDIKILVDSNLPMLRYANPLNLVVDSLLTYANFSDFSMISSYLIALFVWGVALLVICINYLRRESYESI